MEPIHVSYGEYYLYFIVAGAAVGALFGAVPLILGKLKNRRRLGFYGFLASIFFGAILSPLVSIIVVAVFVWLIISKGSNPSSSS